jgi:ribosomal protein S18 acetylase RimI-like enzyme
VTEIQRATDQDAVELTAIQTRTFEDDNQRKPPGCSLEGPPGYDSVAWNTARIASTPYFKIVCDGRIVGGIIVFRMGDGHYELGRIYVDPAFQDQGIGQAAMRQLLAAYPHARRWTLGTPKWALRNQHFYEKLGFVVVRETEVDPHLGWAGVEYERRERRDPRDR